MATIQEGFSAQFTVEAGAVVDVSTAGQARVRVTQPAGDYADVTVSGVPKQFGPLLAGTVVNIYAVSGGVEYQSSETNDNSGSIVGDVRNRAALARAARRLAAARVRNVVVGIFGDSLGAGTGATAVGTLPTNETAANLYGLAGVLRTLFNAPHGTVGGAWLSAASTDGRVTRSAGGAQLASGYGPNYNLDTGGSAMSNSAFLQAGSSHTLTFSLPACTEAKILTWEDYSTGYGRTTSTFSVAVDGGGTVSYAGAETSGSNSTQRLGQSSNLTGMSNASHSIVLAATAGNSMCHGLLYGYATGVTVFSMGVGSASSKNMLALNGSATQQDRIQRATFRGIPLDVAIIIIGHNDASQQASAGTTPAVCAANIQLAINQLRQNTGAPTIILVTDPDTSLTATPFDYRDYWPVICALADGTSDVAAITTRDILGSYAQANAESLYSDTVHLSNNGYAVWGAAIADVLTSVSAA